MEHDQTERQDRDTEHLAQLNSAFKEAYFEAFTKCLKNPVRAALNATNMQGWNSRAKLSASQRHWIYEDMTSVLTNFGKALVKDGLISEEMDINIRQEDHMTKVMISLGYSMNTAGTFSIVQLDSNDSLPIVESTSATGSSSDSDIKKALGRYWQELLGRAKSAMELQAWVDRRLTDHAQCIFDFLVEFHGKRINEFMNMHYKDTLWLDAANANGILDGRFVERVKVNISQSELDGVVAPSLLVQSTGLNLESKTAINPADRMGQARVYKKNTKRI